MLDLSGNYGKPFPIYSCMSCLYSSINREHIGLVRDTGDHPDDLSNLGNFFLDSADSGGDKSGGS